MTLTLNKQSVFAAIAFAAVAALVILDPLPEPQLTFFKNILFWPAAIWLVWLMWTRRADLKVTAISGGILRPVAMVAAIAATLVLARWAAATTGLAQ